MGSKKHENQASSDDSALIDFARRQVGETREREREAALSNLTLSASGEEPGFAEPLPDSFTGYKIVREIHRGGQGVVYLALQRSTSRKVALKVMKDGPFAGAAEQARFEREVQILGQLDHPHIVTIHDSGSVAGHHFFVMDYVPGQSLDVYMAGAQRSIDETLRLFAKICEAVNAAHLRGVIHRDLKPGNIRVDANGEPRILDFGLAKVALGSVGVSPAETSPMTLTGQFVGSLPWASPEQAEGAPSKIDLRTDVYSLGVVLYHMLTGKFPYDVSGNVRDALDAIMTAEPFRPRTLRRQINDEVETILLKCLHKERDRRYQTAGELARDVQHYLAGEPIEAKRDSVGYIVRKQLRRYRFPAAIAASFLILLIGFSVFMTVIYKRAADAEQLAENRRIAAVQALVREANQRQLAEQRQREAETDEQLAREREAEAKQARDDRAVVVQFQSDMLGSVDVERMGRRLISDLRQKIEAGYRQRGASDDEIDAAFSSFDASMRTVNPTDVARRVIDKNILTRAVETIAAQFADQPLIEARLRMTVGNTYRLLGLYKAAEPQLERARDLFALHVDAEQLDRLAAVRNLGVLYTDQGRFDEAEPLLRQALEVRCRVLGEEHQSSLGAMNDLALLHTEQGRYGEAETLFVRTLDLVRQVLGDDSALALKCMNNLADLYDYQARYDEAEPLYVQVLDVTRRMLGDEHPDGLNSMISLVTLYLNQGRYDKAEPLSVQALELSRRVFGDEHPTTLASMQNLIAVSQAQGRLDEAQRLHLQLLELRRRVLGAEHPGTLLSLNNLASLYWRLGRYREAETMFAELVEIRQRVLGEEHPDTLLAMFNLAAQYQAQRRFGEAERLSMQTLELQQNILGDEHPQTLESVNSLAALYWKQGLYDKAEPLYVRGLKARRSALGDENPDTLISMNNLASLYRSLGRYDQAEGLHTQAVAGSRSSLPDGHWYTGVFLDGQAATLMKLERYDAAEAALLEAHDTLESALGGQHRRTFHVIESLVALYKAWHAAEPGQGHAAKATEWREKLPAPATQESSDGN